MKNIVGIRFKPAGKTYYFNPSGFDLKAGDEVIVETTRGMEMGTVVIGNKELSEEQFSKPLKGVTRIATDDDRRIKRENKLREEEAFKICLDKIKEHKLDMKLVEVEYSFDGSKILFYFTAEGRVDFRELVKDLATVFRTRIELRQIGVRDESKALGSIGICGRSLCCSQFLDEFVPVSIKMAKEQGLSLNPSKISGACGRLMCCLKFEQDTYEELIKSLPKQGLTVKTPDGIGKVNHVSILRGIVNVCFEDDNEKVLRDYKADEIEPAKKSKRADKN